MYVAINDRVMPLEEARVSVLDRGYLFGEGVFETLRVYTCVPFLLQEHLARLREGGATLDLKVPRSDKEIGDVVKELLRVNGLRDAYLRLTLTAEGTGRLLPDAPSRSNLLILARELSPYPAYLYEKGASVITSLSIRRSCHTPLAAIKSTSYLENVLARKEASRKGALEAILLNTRNELAEGATSNIFFVSGGEVRTPSLEANILPGITRRVVLEMCARENFPSQEGTFFEKDLEEADEIFLTNSLMEVMPVRELNSCVVGQGLPGLLTLRIASAYKKLITEYVESHP